MIPDHPPRPAGRSGFTTGACAAAAARAATIGLLQGALPPAVETLLPNGARVAFAVAGGQVRPREAEAVVVKDGGSGPDVTHGAHLTARVTPLPRQPGQVVLKGGEGVGRITRPGLELPVGRAAINPIPRANIEANVREAASQLLTRTGLEVVISVPGGEEMARRTLNPRLGIVGGISILGVSGLAHPYSSAAFKATVHQGVAVAAAQQSPAVVLTTGGRTERFAMERLPLLPPIAFVQMGDFLGAALEAVGNATLPRVILAAMPGKMVKIAEGRSNTHARKGTFSPAFLVELARRAGLPRPQLLAGAHTVRHALEILAEEGVPPHPFHHQLTEAARAALIQRLPPRVGVGVILCDFDGHLLATAGDAAWTPFAG